MMTLAPCSSAASTTRPEKDVVLIFAPSFRATGAASASMRAARSSKVSMGALLALMPMATTR
jgi:hypothetical protein